MSDSLILDAGLAAPPALGGTAHGGTAREAALTRAAGEPAQGGPVDAHLVSLLAPQSIEAEQYRALQCLLEPRHRQGELSVLGVTSPGARDGKTTTATNLAGVLAQAPGARVLLVDADLRLPSIARQLGLEGVAEPGLGDAILEPRMPLARVVRWLPRFNLAVVPAGRLPENPCEALRSARLGEIVQEARREFDYVVIDTPPLVPVPDVRVIEPWVDGMLLVVAAHRTPQRLLEEALANADPGKLLGLVFNDDDRLMSHTYGYCGYAYKDGRGAGQGRDAKRGNAW